MLFSFHETTENLLSSVRQIYRFCCNSFKAFDRLIKQMNFWPPERDAEQMRPLCGTGLRPLASLLREDDIWQVDAAVQPFSPSTLGETGPNLNCY